ncbi:hypothetical protein BKA82DRAFT_877563 [Pisolithus tinctorius]|uniref:Uncharacterized protein n=1 Tax=Pisolithus tinctorius Marx 270 TaxID=870435 RepID=A0A0C3PQN2_PISTI|nr:hypothetical protein BKA82DRAFT_877563 [Pisolithus tinctorius]KIO10829.1 hypothetical protein M404DRAFT_877563 [Pisolithus tinctorius Marx 270]
MHAEWRRQSPWLHECYVKSLTVAKGRKESCRGDGRGVWITCLLCLQLRLIEIGERRHHMHQFQKSLCKCCDCELCTVHQYRMI